METTTKKNDMTTRSLMPRGYIKLLQERTGYSPGAISSAIKNEDLDSPIWPEVLKLAKETQQKRHKAQEQLNKLKAVAA